MSETEHNLFGLGKATYTYTETPGKFHLTLHTADIDLEFKGHKARKIFNRLHRDSLRVSIAAAKKYACQSTGIYVGDLPQATRRREVVFARAMVYHYLTTELNFSLGMAAEEVGGPTNHATVLNAIEMYNREDKALTPNEREWKSTFNKLIK